MLLWATTWFGVIVPLHERGRYTLPGPAPTHCLPGQATSKVSKTYCMEATSGCPACCGLTQESPSKKQDGPPSPSPTQKGHCAICHLLALVCAPPALEILPVPVELVRPLTEADYSTARPKVCYSPCQSRAPPCCHG